MGVGENFAEAFRKASAGAGEFIPQCGRAFLSVKDSDKEGIVNLVKQLVDIGFEIVATSVPSVFCRGMDCCVAKFIK